MVRLDRDTFGKAQDLRAGPGSEEGVWRVSNDYKIERRKGGVRYLIASGDRWRTVRPLEERGLMIELARLREEAFERRDFEEPIVRFVRKRGLLGLDRPEYINRRWHGGPRETVRKYIAEIIRAGEIVRLYEAVLNGNESAAKELLRDFPCQVPDGERLGEDDTFYRMAPLERALVEVTMAVTRRVNELCRVTAIPPMRSHDVSKVRTVWTFDSLIGAAYLQMYWLIGAEGRITRCGFCRHLIPYPRKNQSFCNDSCRNKNDNHSGRRAERARQKAAKK